VQVNSSFAKMNPRKVILMLVAIIALGLCASMLIRTQRVKAAQPCWGKLVNIEAAKEQWALETHAAPGASVTLSNILPYLSGPPTCNVAGASYATGKVGEEPSCSVHGTVSHFKPDHY
jgi:hypothetical protein